MFVSDPAYFHFLFYIKIYLMRDRDDVLDIQIELFYFYQNRKHSLSHAQKRSKDTNGRNFKRVSKMIWKVSRFLITAFWLVEKDLKCDMRPAVVSVLSQKAISISLNRDNGAAS